MLPERYLLSPNTADRLRDSLAEPPRGPVDRHAGALRSAPLVRRGALLTANPLVYRGRLVGRPSPNVPWEDLGTADVALAPLNSGFLGLGRVYVAAPSGFTAAEGLPVYWTSGEAIEDESSSGSSEDSSVDHICEGTRSQWTDYKPACEAGCLVFYTRTMTLVVDADGCPRVVVGPWVGPHPMPGDCGLAFENCNGSSGSSGGVDLVFTDCCPQGINRTLHALIEAGAGQACNGVTATATFTEGAIPADEFNPAFDGWMGVLSWDAVIINYIVYCNTSGDWVIRYGDCAGGDPVTESVLNVSSCDPLLLFASMGLFACAGCADEAMDPAVIYFTDVAP